MSYHKNRAAEEGEKWWSTVKDSGPDKYSWGGSQRQQQDRQSRKSLILLQLQYSLAQLFCLHAPGNGRSGCSARAECGGGVEEAVSQHWELPCPSWACRATHWWQHLVPITLTRPDGKAGPRSRQTSSPWSITVHWKQKIQVLQVSRTEVHSSKDISSPSQYTALKYSKSLPNYPLTGWVYKSCSWPSDNAQPDC